MSEAAQVGRNAGSRVFLVTRAPDEPEESHRGFLLWGMQAANRRSYRAAGAAIGKGDSTIRYWSRRFDWPLRVQQANADLACIHEYRRLYHDRHRDEEVMRVAELMRHDYHAPAVEQSAAAAAPMHADAEAAEREARDRQRKQALELMRKLGGASLAKYAQAIQEGKVRVNRPSDLLDLAKLQQFLDGVERDDAQGRVVAGPLAVESVRVRQARANGTNVLVAALEDVRDLEVVLHHLLASAAEAPPLQAPVAAPTTVDEEEAAG